MQHAAGSFSSGMQTESAAGFQQLLQNGENPLDHPDIAKIARMYAVNRGFIVRAEKRVALQICHVPLALFAEFAVNLAHRIPAAAVVLKFLAEKPSVRFGGVFHQQNRRVGTQLAETLQERFRIRADLNPDTYSAWRR